MSDVIEILKLVGAGMSRLAAANREQRAEVARHFLNLANTFNSFPPAHEARNFTEMRRLAAKTHGHLDSLRQTEVFSSVLGTDAERFFKTIETVSNAKDLMSDDKSPTRITEIIEAAGYFEGFHETLSAGHDIRSQK